MKVLFVCRENTCRSVMAESVFRKLSSEKHDVLSAGVKSSEKFDEMTLRVLERRGYPPAGSAPRKLEDVDLNDFDIVILVCDEAECVILDHPGVERWTIKDPKGKDEKDYCETLEIIEEKVVHLLRRFENESA